MKDLSSRLSRRAAAALLASAALVPGLVEAQETQGAAGDEAISDNQIIVTAQRRAERLTDVSIAIDVLSAEALAEARISQIENLAQAVPNINIKEQVPGAIPVVTIRGIGLDDFSATNSPSAGIYVDEIPLVSTALMSSEIYDLERIEVLKGPQGTLYGRNSTAGAINIITAKPTQELAGSLTAGYGNYENFEAEGFINLPLSETLALRISARTVQQGEGFWTSRLLPGETLGERDILTGRLQLRWQPRNDIDVNLKIEGYRSDSELGQGEFFGAVDPSTGGPCASYLSGSPDPAQCTDFFGYSDTDGDPFTGDWARDAFYDIDSWDATLKVEADLGAATLTSISGYRWQDRGFDVDSDATPARQVDFVQNDRIEQYSQELHMSGETGIAEWIVGGFYSHDEVTVFTPGNHLDLFATQTVIDAEQETDAAAIFVNVGWKIAERLKFVTGLRLTHEKRSYVGGTSDLNPLGFSFLCIPAQLCVPGVPGPAQLSFIDDRIKDTNLTGRVALEFKPSDDSLIYASVARGRKSGGYFSGITTSSGELLPYQPETLTAYELGARAELANRRLLADASLFYYDYDDVQTFIRVDSGPITIQKLGNIDNARVYGADIDLTWLPVKGLSLFAGAGLLDTRLGAFATSAGPVAAGNKLPNAPDFTFTGRVRYEFAVTPEIDLILSGNAHYSDQVFKDARNNPVIAGDSYWLFDARIAVAADDKGWEVALWGRNLSDNRHVVQGLDAGALGFGNRTYNSPRTYGVTATIRF